MLLSHIDITPTIQVENTTIGLELGAPCEKSKKIAFHELRESPENRQKGLEAVKNILDSKSTS